jgi:hypothetical protein
VQNHSGISTSGGVVDNARLRRENRHRDGSAGGSVVYVYFYLLGTVAEAGPR